MDMTSSNFQYQLAKGSLYLDYCQLLDGNKKYIQESNVLKYKPSLIKDDIIVIQLVTIAKYPNPSSNPNPNPPSNPNPAAIEYGRVYDLVFESISEISEFCYFLYYFQPKLLNTNISLFIQNKLLLNQWKPYLKIFNTAGNLNEKGLGLGLGLEKEDIINDEEKSISSLSNLSLINKTYAISKISFNDSLLLDDDSLNTITNSNENSPTPRISPMVSMKSWKSFTSTNQVEDDENKEENASIGSIEVEDVVMKDDILEEDIRGSEEKKQVVVEVKVQVIETTKVTEDHYGDDVQQNNVDEIHNVVVEVVDEVNGLGLGLEEVKEVKVEETHTEKVVDKDLVEIKELVTEDLVEVKDVVTEDLVEVKKVMEINDIAKEIVQDMKPVVIDELKQEVEVKELSSSLMISNGNMETVSSFSDLQIPNELVINEDMKEDSSSITSIPIESDHKTKLTFKKPLIEESNVVTNESFDVTPLSILKTSNPIDTNPIEIKGEKNLSWNHLIQIVLDSIEQLINILEDISLEDIQEFFQNDSRRYVVMIWLLYTLYTFTRIPFDLMRFIVYLILTTFLIVIAFSSIQKKKLE